MRILFIDDHESILECISPFFTNQGFEVNAVLGAEAGASAMRQGNYDVIVCDREMPVFTGLHLAQLRKDLGITAPFFLYTGEPNVHPEVMNDLGITGVFDKTQIAELVATLCGLKEICA